MTSSLGASIRGAQCRGLVENGSFKWPVAGHHAVAVLALTDLHRDLFDWVLVAQVQAERIVLLIYDAQVAACPGSMRRA